MEANLKSDFALQYCERDLSVQLPVVTLLFLIIPTPLHLVFSANQAYTNSALRALVIITMQCISWSHRMQQFGG